DTCVFIKCFALKGTGIGFRTVNPSGATGPRLTRFTNCFSESNTQSGFSIEAGREIKLLDCHAAVNGGHGIVITGGTDVTCVGGLSLQNQNYGWYITGGTGVALIGVSASNNSQA